jgi:hypothetical protein
MSAGGQHRKGRPRGRLEVCLRWLGALVLLLAALDEARYGGNITAPGVVVSLGTGEDVVETRISPPDIDRVRLGATAAVRTTGPVIAELPGQIALRSSELVVGREAGETYYLVRITLAPEARPFLAAQSGKAVSAWIEAEPRYLLRELLPPPRRDPLPYRAD